VYASAERNITPLLSVVECVKAVQKSFHSRTRAPHSLNQSTATAVTCLNATQDVLER